MLVTRHHTPSKLNLLCKYEVKLITVRGMNLLFLRIKDVMIILLSMHEMYIVLSGCLTVVPPSSQPQRHDRSRSHNHDVSA